ncbi:MAG: hypothetical protein ABJK37_08990 [Paraglaciecola sp.]|uniref:hypothetical protein n=1 Tax=Paraglaciecola sp. TaxID=1920173 RepID=UPI00329A7780
MRFIRASKTVKAVVFAKVYRNKSTETRSSRTKVLKLRFQNPYSGSNEYVCDINILTPFYKVNDNIDLAVSENKILIKSGFYVMLAPVSLALMGGICVYVFYQL